MSAPSLDLGGVTVTWLADIPSMGFAADDLLVPGGGDQGPGHTPGSSAVIVRERQTLRAAA